ncbi:D-amino acid dehydrogenase [Massilia jejuensis]|uniref:D-amino acid dehydrogenase n=1 Tax=Massilia jejuensis TaxID=648894 RepID=A0ABW0PFQ7_9BURK
MQQVIVIGGGVVGLTSAWWLLEAGFGVTVVERAPQVASGASYGNGGQLSYRYVSPLADAGVPLKAIAWLFQEHGPLRFKPELDLRQWRWLASFLGQCTTAANRRTTAKLLELGELSRTGMQQLEAIVSPDDFAWRDAGKLVVYRSPAVFEQAAGKATAGAIWSGDECAAREPALGAARSQLAGGIYNRGEAVADCHAFCVALAERVRAHPRFAGFVQAEVTRIAAAGGRVAGLDTSIGTIGGDAFVLAAGIESRNLARHAGIALPLYPLKGYSLTAPIRPGDTAPGISVTDFERKVLYARIGDKLRVAAMVDMVGENLALNPKRIGSLTRQVRETMPHAADYDRISAWAGLRPATPNSAPLIGATALSNLWLNVGHGPLGFTFAAGTARVLADLMRGKAPPFALDMLAPGR